MSKFSFMKKLAALAMAASLIFSPIGNTVTAHADTNFNGTMMQYFEWYLSNNGSHWNNLKNNASDLSEKGFTALWLPPAYKGLGGTNDVGYAVYDLYDLGEFDQKGTIRTKYGTKDEYLAAIAEAHKQGIQIYGDIVLNHKMGGDYKENLYVTEVAGNNRYHEYGSMHKEFWTGFTFPGRGNKYSSFKWNSSHFDGNDDYGKIYKFSGKSWDENTDRENGNYDYLMGADLDMNNREVVDELKTWGKWYTDFASLDGYRIDAIKHIDSNFFKEWLDYQRNESGKELFAVGEYWNTNRGALESYLAATEYKMQLFDVPLHKLFIDASYNNGNFDMRRLSSESLVSKHPALSVTFVDNHDSQPGQMLGPQVNNWFKPLAYTFILTRQDGYPCVFYGDYYGVSDSGHEVPSIKNELDKIMKVRKDLAYGPQHDYFDSSDLIGWTREGNDSHANSGLAALLTDKLGGSKRMYVGTQNSGKVYYDITGNITSKVTIDSSGHGNFSVNNGSYSIWVKDTSASNLIDVNFTLNNGNTIFGENIYIVGNTPELGDWNTDNAVPLTTYDGLYPTWKCSVPFSSEGTIEFKFIKKYNGNVIWQTGSNRTYTINKSSNNYVGSWN